MEKNFITAANVTEKSVKLRGSTIDAGAVKQLEPLLCTTAQARALLGCGPTRLYDLLANEQLRARRLGPRTMIEAASVHELVASLPLVITPTRQRREAEARPAI